MNTVTPNTAITIAICTYNRKQLLTEAIASILDQKTGAVEYELLVVENNCTDGTAEILEGFAREHQKFRWCPEPRQGLSYARNTAIQRSESPIIAFVDDDIRAADDWILSIYRAFAEHPHAWFVGGKILPLWAKAPEPWLRPTLGPLGLQDHGASVRESNLANRLMMIGGNLAFRRETFDRVGLFAPDLQRVKGSIGSMEDRDFLTRIWKAGGAGVYDPRIQVWAEVTEDRMTKEYHRRWHEGSGHYTAIFRDDAIETDGLRLFDVPGHMYRQAINDAARVIRYRLMRDDAAAFDFECRLRFFKGYYTQRRIQYNETATHGTIASVLSFGRQLLQRR